MHLTSFGAAETVTGSCHLLELGGQHLLVDCGLFQGEHEVENLNRAPFPFDARGLSAVILTHAHLDHVGRLPLLTQRGYRGPIYCTAPTAELAELVLMDSARLQLEDHKQALRKARRAGREDELPGPLYDERDAMNALALLRPELHVGEPLQLGNVTVTPRRAGHILGSVYLEFQSPEGRVTCSGDLGNRESGLQQDFEPPSETDALLIETTYAGRTHRSLDRTLAEFTRVIRESADRGGKILIPSFALERTQTILYELKRLMDAREVPRIPVFLDSPMAAQATYAYFDHGAELRHEVRDALAHGEDPFWPSTLHVVATSTESQRLNRYEGSAIIIAGNGMMSGGRILHHLKHHLWKPSTSLVMVSYQSPSSLGGRIIAGAESVHIMGEEVRVAAQVHTIGGFSAHADQDDLLAWLAGTGRAHVWLTHGDAAVMQDFLPVLAAAGRTADITPRGVRVDLTHTHYPQGRPADLKSAPDSHHRQEE